MSIVTKISDDEYTVGIYTVRKEGDNWAHLHGENERLDALYFHRDEALRSAVIKHTCGQLVAEGIRELLHLRADEIREEGTK